MFFTTTLNVSVISSHVALCNDSSASSNQKSLYVTESLSRKYPQNTI